MENKAINRNINQTTKEKSILTWAIINGKVEWAEGKLDTAKWLRERFELKLTDIESIVCGYIVNPELGRIDVVYFSKSSRDKCDLENSLLAKVLLIADLSFNFERIYIYNGLRLINTLERMNIKHAETVLTKVDYSSKLVSVKELLDYEDKLVRIINEASYSNTSIFRRELTMSHVILNKYLTNEEFLMDGDFKRRIKTYNSLI